MCPKPDVLYETGEAEPLLAEATAAWPSLDEPLPEEISELCRFAFIRATETGRRAESQLWRARAMTSAMLSDARHTVAGLLLPHYMTILAQAQEDPDAPSAAQSYDTARLVLDEMKRLIPPGSSHWKRLFARLFHDKRALSYLLEATKGGPPIQGQRHLLEKAADDYRTALPHTEGPGRRGELKVRGNLALVQYLLTAHAEGEGEGRHQEAREETATIRDSATKAGYGDVARWATLNHVVMTRGEFVGWSPYEVL